ncbi:ureidoglycolate dehydrogenase [Enorma phocaeensis]|uniref:Ureidoglycolate dehydrogenase n=1 Tax=Enorma phocaeensis TaxID=1871019 RepID=A0A921LS70_9ACTN|nr:ureidoglycolate dehydrogenase [Enorma phocaeensis]HJG36918.1 ureidoglycolate dehydrogenase [Enorma phocaeensis]
MIVPREELKQLMKNKFMAAGLHEDHAEDMAEVLTWSSERGLHSHGEVRVEYYTERISKGGTTIDPEWTWKQTGPCSGILDGDNGCGYPFAIMGMKKAIELAKENGIGFVGVANVGHTGAISYYTEMAAKEGMIGFSCTQSDPMVIPYGGAEPFYGTNPIAIAAPTADGRIVSFDMATTVQAWGKILDAKSAGRSIPEGWAVDEDGLPVTDPHKVNALVAIAGAKGYGLMMMVDILSGVLLGVPAGKHVSSMYHDLSEGRRLGHLNIAINPEFFCGDKQFREAMSVVLDELNAVKPGVGFDKVYWPGERAQLRIQATKDAGGIEIVDDIYDYLVSDDLYRNSWDHKNRFAE